jgi:hypothetical protein
MADRPNDPAVPPAAVRAKAEPPVLDAQGAIGKQFTGKGAPRHLLDKWKLSWLN